ncbi:alpha/beta fold hydrolase [Flavisolibacter nicotianae]|uniref:alpha/beta fold hydrolase n=1 Tax=Flavisolibacter nicotianae TaxID=2364882 RepID=UPI000EAFC396|nr:alpha/beta hydrolase [Flavisolibacter nicotianae]
MTEAIFTLSDDRKLSYAVYGPADGEAVLYFHGTPSSRKEILLLENVGVDFDQMLLACRLKIIVPDRGALTTFHPRRTFRSFAEDSMELLRHLGISQCAVLCWSGGGPYALAAASCFPNTVTSVYILCGITRVFDKQVLKQMGLNKWYFLTARYASLLLQLSLAVVRQTKTLHLPKQWLTGLPYVDYRLLQKIFREVTNLTLKEAIRKGTRAAVHEAAMYFSDYGFSVNNIQQPIHYWWGTMDMSVVELHALEVAQKAPQPVMHYREGEGHLSLYVRCFGEALQAIAQANATCTSSDR